MRKHALIIGGNDSSAVKAAQLGIDVTLFQLSRLLTPAQKESATRVFVFDFEKNEETIAFAKTLHHCYPVDAVASFWERGLLAAALVSETLQVPGNPLNAVKVTRDKFRMRQLLHNNGFENIRSCKCHSRSDLAVFLNDVGRPVVLKPNEGSGSAGVSLVSTETDIASAWSWAAETQYASFIAEEYIAGPEYSVETLSVNGQHRVLGITEKITTGAPHFIETGHIFPANLSAAIAERIAARVCSLLTLVGHQIGPAHTEIRLQNDEPVIIETQTRFGGDQIWEMVELVTGVNLTTTTMAYLLGLESPDPTPQAAATAIRFFAFENCYLDEVGSLETAKSMPGVLRVDCKLQAQQKLGPLRQSKDRQGYVLATGECSEHAWQLASRAWENVKIAVNPAPQLKALRPRFLAATRRVQQLLDGVRQDERRVENMLALTANENLSSRLCRSLLSSNLGDSYHLGAPSEHLPSDYMVKGGLMLKGLPRVCALEHAAQLAARDLFEAQLSDFRPLSGVHATVCTVASATKPGDNVYSIAPVNGGHFATRVLLHRLGRRSFYLPWDSEQFIWNMGSVVRAFRRSPPSAVLLDLGIVLKPLPVQTLRDLVGPSVRIIYDASHSLGLIAGKVFPNPLAEGSDVLQGNTHKTFPGPQKAMLHFRDFSFGTSMCAKLSAGFVSSQHTHQSLALYIAILEMQTFGREYALQVVSNAATLESELELQGFEILRDADAKVTQSNTIVVRRIPGIDPYLACEILLRCGISTNARPFCGKGVLRLGTQQVTRQGMKETEMRWIAEAFKRALLCRERTRSIRREVGAFMANYRNVHYSFDQAFGWC